MFTKILYILAIGMVILSFSKDKKKTKMGLKKAWKTFENILPQFLAILLIIGLMLSILDQDTISKLLGKESGWLGMIIAGGLGSITLIPGFVAFPLVDALLKNGAGYMQITMFVSTLMMVGIVTIPVEIQYFGKKTALARNIMGLGFSFIVAIVMGAILG
ncbi:Predicted permease [Desulfonispora thiosulfatigenes DSM 11270]|uniref:Predicted permease n=1 Tax=Desulfonispora thiosulfatigenes DSM 11270 TaxID=656914 RepID=A0A1W1UDT1_DESTI|nr:permease [Desulfonispora thiosulfatigenes]SMB79209.1 Predicted permease [Desulfonispora thiosulfatigenes DSM 11270]